MKKVITTTKTFTPEGVIETETIEETIEEATEQPARRPPVVQFVYNGKRRVVEAFHITFAPGTRNILLVGQELNCDHPKAFILDNAMLADFTGVKFVAVGAERE